MKSRARTASSSPDDVFRLAVRFLTYRDRTSAQVGQFLASHGVSPSRAKQAIRRLTELRYLDDAAFARRYAEKRMASRPVGQERLREELQAKGIADRLADRVVTDVFRALDEEALAQRVVYNAQRHGRRLTPIQIGRLLHQRGFTEETIDHIMVRLGINKECAHEESCD